MRVVAGELRGRRLAAPPRGAPVRPTSDRVREALFSILGSRVEDARVLDLFCGTGALGIEALSRGAAHATLVDDDISLAQRNIDSLDLRERARLVQSDALRHLRQLRRQRDQFDLILCDPPYTLADRLQGPLDKLISPLLADDGVVALESAARDPLRLSLPPISQRAYGDTHIAIYGGDDG